MRLPRRSRCSISVAPMRLPWASTTSPWAVVSLSTSTRMRSIDPPVAVGQLFGKLARDQPPLGFEILGQTIHQQPLDRPGDQRGEDDDRHQGQPPEGDRQACSKTLRHRLSGVIGRVTGRRRSAVAGRFEAIAHAPDGVDVDGSVRVRFDLLAQRPNVDVQRALVAVEVRPPDRVEQVAAGRTMPARSASSRSRSNSRAERWTACPSTVTVRASRSMCTPPTISSPRAAGPPPGLTSAAQIRPNPGQQLARRERLGHVIVGAGVQADHLVGLLATRRQHDHRTVPEHPQPPGDFDAVQVGQADVEQDEVRRVAASRVERIAGRSPRRRPRSLPGWSRNSRESVIRGRRRPAGAWCPWASPDGLARIPRRMCP